MRVLFISHRLPHSEVAGGHRLVFQRIQYLASKGYEVGLVSFVEKTERTHLDSLKKMLFELETVKAHGNGLVRRILNYFRPVPAIFSRHRSQRMMRLVGDMVERSDYDVVIAEFSEMGQYLHRNPFLPAVTKIISCHRCLTSSFRKYVETREVSWLLRIKSLVQSMRIRKHEFNIYYAVDLIMVLTARDQFDLQYYASDLNIRIVPMGVDVEYLREGTKAYERQPNLLMTGYYGDVANRDAVQWFVKNVWPKLRHHNPALNFYVVGSSPTWKIRHMARKDKRIKVTGKVHDLRPYRNKARIFICPVRLGGGARTKCLEAMASRIPVVSTSLGMEGLPAENGNNCLIADTPELMRHSIQWLLDDSELAGAIAEQAQKMIDDRFSIAKSMGYFEKTIQELVNGG